MPFTLLGFPLQGFSLSQSLQALSSLAALLPLVFLLCEQVRNTSPTGLCSLRESVTCRTGVTRTDKPLPSWFFNPPGISPLPNRSRLHETYPLELSLPPLPLKRIPEEREPDALQGLQRGRIGLSFTRPPPLLSFLHLVSNLRLRYPAMPGLWFHPAIRCCYQPLTCSSACSA